MTAFIVIWSILKLFYNKYKLWNVFKIQDKSRLILFLLYEFIPELLENMTPFGGVGEKTFVHTSLYFSFYILISQLIWLILCSNALHQLKWYHKMIRNFEIIESKKNLIIHYFNLMHYKYIFFILHICREYLPTMCAVFHLIAYIKYVQKWKCHVWKTNSVKNKCAKYKQEKKKNRAAAAAGSVLWKTESIYYSISFILSFTIHHCWIKNDCFTVNAYFGREGDSVLKREGKMWRPKIPSFNIEINRFVYQ